MSEGLTIRGAVDRLDAAVEGPDLREAIDVLRGTVPDSEAPIALLAISDSDDGDTLDIKVQFDPPYNGKDDDANPLAFKAAGSFVSWLREKLS